jgi:hypothetical protein
MDRVEAALPGAGVLGKILFPILALIALYYLYQFLFGPSDLKGETVIKSIVNASPDMPFIVTGDKLPVLFEGGEYSINFWLYVNDFSVNHGRNKFILSLGGSTFLTILIYLGPYKNTLNVRIHTVDTTSSSVAPQVAMGSTAPGPGDLTDNLLVSNLETIFDGVQQDSSLLTPMRPCDVANIDLQKWIQVTVALNVKTCDVYVDGKLARSCVLPSFYRVDRSAMMMKITDYKGFGGFVSNVSAYNYALNPEQVWKLYMAGPGPQYTLLEYLKSLFDPTAMSAYDYPKQNIIQ